MKPFLKNIERLTLANFSFRQVLYTSKHAQIVVMSLKPDEEIGMEVHNTVDQFLRIEQGQGKIVINKKTHSIKDGTVHKTKQDAESDTEDRL